MKEPYKTYASVWAGKYRNEYLPYIMSMPSRSYMSMGFCPQSMVSILPLT